MAAKAANYKVLRGTLYQRGKSTLWLKEVYQGIYEAHKGATMLMNKIFQQGFFWPTIKRRQMSLLKSVISANSLGMELTHGQDRK